MPPLPPLAAPGFSHRPQLQMGSREPQCDPICDVFDSLRNMHLLDIGIEPSH